MNNLGVAPDQIGMFIVTAFAVVSIACGCLWAAVLVKSLRAKPDPDKEFVTREEMKNCLNELEDRIAETRKDLGNKVDTLASYQRTSSHELANSMNAMALKVERLLTLREYDGKSQEHKI